MKKADGFSVDLKKEMFYILRRWIFILVTMLVFSGLVGGLKYYLDKNEYISQKDAPVKDTTLNDSELEDVNYAVMYTKQMNELTEYLESSIYVNIDYHNVNTTKLTYSVEPVFDENLMYEEKQVEVASLVEVYKLYAGGDSILTDINATEKYQLENRYIAEMITVVGYSDDDYVDKLCVYIINHEKLEGLAKEVKDAVEGYCTELNKKGYKHKLNLIEEINYTTVDSKVLSASQGLQSDIYTTNTRYAKAVNELTDEQKLVYNKIINGEAVNMEELFPKDKASVGKPRLDMVFVIAGALIGLIIACGLLILKFSLSDKVMSDKDFDGLFGLKYLGILFDDKYLDAKKKSIINRLEYGDLLESEYKEKMNFVAVKLKLMCDKKQINKVALISSDYDNLSDEITKDLCVRLKKEDLELVKVDNVLTDSKEMRKLFEIGVCVFVESTNKTKIKKMNQLVELCDENNIDKLGVVEINA